MGRPRILRAWCYRDVFGAQASVSILFDYAARKHALSVLIDHELGGGSRTAGWPRVRPVRGMRARTATQMAGNPMAQFEDIDAEQAFAMLQAPLARPVCPEQEDQIEDVAANLALLRARMALLAAEAGVSVIEPAPS